VVLLAMSAGTGFADLGFGPPMPLNSEAESDGPDVRDTEPVIATDGVGTWIAAWTHADPLEDEDIFASISTDGGENWGPQQVVNSNAAVVYSNDRSPQLTSGGSGVWLVVWASNDDMDGTTGDDDDLFFSRSTDNGQTWSPAAVLNTNAFTDSRNDEAHHMASDGEGNWIVVWHSEEDLGGTAGTDLDILYSRSIDNGVTWSPPALLHPSAETDSVVDEIPRIETDRAGRWIVVWQSYGTESHVYCSRSDDSGATWSTPSALPNSGSDIRPDIAADGLGNWVVVWQSYDADAPTGADYDLFSSHSTDSGVSWSAPVLLNSTAWSDTVNDGFPAITSDGQGNWLTIWQHHAIPFGGGGGTKEVFVSRSQDNGASWSPPESLKSTTEWFPYYRCGLETDREGKWIAAWDSDDNIGGIIDTDWDILFSSSINLGDPSTVEKEEWILYR